MAVGKEEAEYELGACEFDDLSLDPRLVEAAKALGWQRPTIIQASCIPVALHGKDVLAKSRTGSGKTGAYLMPTIQRLIQRRVKSARECGELEVLILVPTKELCAQVSKQAKQLTRFLRQSGTEIAVVAVGGEQSMEHQRPLLQSGPDIVVATPSCLLRHLRATPPSVCLSGLKTLVIDEADMLLAESADLTTLQESIPRGCQTHLMSATLTDDARALASALLTNHIYIELEADDRFEGMSAIRQSVVWASPMEKHLLFYVMHRMGWVKGKMMIFVTKAAHAIRLKLFLEAFAIESAVLSAEVPQASRNHVIQQFNSGAITILIATDEAESKYAKLKSGKDVTDGDDGEGPAAVVEGMSVDQVAGEYGLHRGMDFNEVDFVINFDLPETLEHYVHRIGRTGRAGHKGAALSFATHPQDDEFIEGLTQAGQDDGNPIKEVVVPPQVVNKFRYRAEDVVAGITKKVIKKARLAEIAREILNSQKLQSHFDDNPKDLVALQHLSEAGPKRDDKLQLAHIPDYLGFTDEKTKKKERKKRKRARNKGEEGEGEETGEGESGEPSAKKRRLSAGQKRQADPLQTLSFKRAQKVDKRMTNMDLTVIDPQGLHRRKVDWRHKKKQFKMDKGKSQKKIAREKNRRKEGKALNSKGGP